METWAEKIGKSEQPATAPQSDKEAVRQILFDRRHTPMTERITRVLRNMPESEQSKERPIEFFVHALAPKWSGKHAANREVAAALRELGWARVRCWRAELGGFRATWQPPVHRDGSAS